MGEGAARSGGPCLGSFRPVMQRLSLRFAAHFCAPPPQGSQDAEKQL